MVIARVRHGSTKIRSWDANSHGRFKLGLKAEIGIIIISNFLFIHISNTPPDLLPSIPFLVGFKDILPNSDSTITIIILDVKLNTWQNKLGEIVNYFINSLVVKKIFKKVFNLYGGMAFSKVNLVWAVKINFFLIHHSNTPS